jgi:hypothetical protein
VLALVDSSGSVLNTYEYDVFGAVRSSTGSTANAFTFTGEQTDSSTGLEYLGARYYDSSPTPTAAGSPVQSVPICVKLWQISRGSEAESARPADARDPRCLFAAPVALLTGAARNSTRGDQPCS